MPLRCSFPSAFPTTIVLHEMHKTVSIHYILMHMMKLTTFNGALWQIKSLFISTIKSAKLLHFSQLLHFCYICFQANWVENAVWKIESMWCQKNRFISWYRKPSQVLFNCNIQFSYLFFPTLCNVFSALILTYVH